MALTSDFKNPIWWRNILLRNVILPILFGRNEGTYVTHEVWNNLIILDACRYDLFEEVMRAYGIPGKLGWRNSRGTTTESFIRENFLCGPSLDDIVYVTANPFVSKLANDRFFRVIPVWKTSWDQKNNTVLPEDVCRYALQASAAYRDKRLIVHFLQPHRPFLGHPRASWSGPRLKHRLFHVYAGSEDEHLVSTNRSLLRDLYRENLSMAIPCVQELLHALPGLSVVTADHGEALGERLHPLLPMAVFGHPRGARIPELVKVPWFVSETSGPREPSIRDVEESDMRMDMEDEALIQDRLKSLGYL